MNAVARAALAQASGLNNDNLSTVEGGLTHLVTRLQTVKHLPDGGREMGVLRDAGRALDQVLSTASAHEVVVMFKNMATIASMSGALAREYEQASIDHLVRAIMPGASMGPADIQQRLMIATARKAVLESGDWVTAAQIAELANFSTRNVSAQPNKWKRAGDIFAISFNGQDYFPLYGLDPGTHRPRKTMRDVVNKFGAAKDGWGLAYWFASVNGYLGGARPQDILGDDPEAVLAAVDAEMAAVAHG